MVHLQNFSDCVCIFGQVITEKKDSRLHKQPRYKYNIPPPPLKKESTTIRKNNWLQLFHMQCVLHFKSLKSAVCVNCTIWYCSKVCIN